MDTNVSLSENQISARMGIVLRQSRYYLYAMRFLDILDERNNLSDYGRYLRQLKDRIRELSIELKSKILSKPVFSEVYLHFAQNHTYLGRDAIAGLIVANSNLCYSTSFRRATTVSKWIEWCMLIR